MLNIFKCPIIIVSSCHVNIVPGPGNPSEWDVSSSLASVITPVSSQQTPDSRLPGVILSPSCHPRVWLLSPQVVWHSNVNMVSILHDGWPGSRIRNQWSQYLINWVTSKVNSLQIFGFLTISEFDMFTVHSLGQPAHQHGQPWLVRQVSIYPLEMYI